MKHKGNHGRDLSLQYICDRTHVDFCKPFASMTYTTSIENSLETKQTR